MKKHLDEWFLIKAGLTGMFQPIRDYEGNLGEIGFKIKGVNNQGNPVSVFLNQKALIAIRKEHIACKRELKDERKEG